MVDIRKKIKDAGFTLEEIGTKIGKSKSQMTVIVNGKGNPTIKTLELIADAMKISVSELLADNTTPAHSLTCPHCGKPLSIKIE